MIILKKNHDAHIISYLHWDRNLIGTLFEDWLQSGKNWLSSTTYANATRTTQQRKKGVHLMKPRSWLMERYNNDATVVDGIIASKREAQHNRKPNEPIYVMKDPNVPNDRETWHIYVYALTSGCKFKFVSVCILKICMDRFKLYIENT